MCHFMHKNIKVQNLGNIPTGIYIRDFIEIPTLRIEGVQLFD